MPRGNRGTRTTKAKTGRKKSTKPKVKPGERVQVGMAGEELEAVLKCYDQIGSSIVPVELSVVLRDNRATLRKYVEAYLKLIRPTVVELMGGEEQARRGIPNTHPRYGEFLDRTEEHRTKRHRPRLHTVGLKQLLAEGVRVSGGALDLLIELGAIVDDR